MVVIAAGTANAADKSVTVKHGGTAVGFMRHNDGGDVFQVFDIHTDGHGVRGSLLDVNQRVLATQYVGGGSGDIKQFTYDVKAGKTYFMKVCTFDGAGDTTPIDCERAELHE
ncbi:hypothetical protein CP982_22095 [Streptomyces spectabilis]|nr:hypothetical protein CP982_22095 [Streptomyces spectabilis]